MPNKKDLETQGQDSHEATTEDISDEGEDVDTILQAILDPLLTVSELTSFLNHPDMLSQHHGNEQSFGHCLHAELYFPFYGTLGRV